MSLAVMPIRSVPWAEAGPGRESGGTTETSGASSRARSRMTKRLMASLLGDEVTAGGVAGGHGVERWGRGRADRERARTPRRERAAGRQRGEVRGRARDRDERAPLLAPAHGGLHQPGGVRVRGAPEQLADRRLLDDAAGVHHGGVVRDLRRDAE